MNDLRAPQHRSTERTPLLRTFPRSRRELPEDNGASQPTDGLPHIGPFVAEMKQEDLQKYTLDNLYPPTLQSHSSQAAFSLCSLLYFRKYLYEPSPRGRDLWTQWRQEQRNAAAASEVDSLIGRVWDRFLEEEIGSVDVADVLWSAYPLYPDSRRTVRIVNFLASGDAPQEFLSHSLVYLSLADTWQYGRPRDSHESTLSRIFQFVDGTATPQLLHIIDLLLYLAYLGNLIAYLVDPPPQATVATSNLRGGFILLYALSRLCRPWSASTLPFAIVVLSFIFALPSTPLPNSYTYSYLLLAFAWKVILLHLPVYPGPLFLLSREQILPLAILVWRGLARTFVPVVAFFIPGLFISWILLAISVQNKFLWLMTELLAFASPMESRVTFLSLFTIFILFLCCALGFSVLVYPFFSPLDGSPPSAWDRYSKSVGLEARQAYVRAVSAYATPYFFPAPFNLLHTLLVQIPRGLVVLLGWKSPLKWLGLAKRVLWRFTVAAFTFPLSALCLWNLRTR